MKAQIFIASLLIACTLAGNIPQPTINAALFTAGFFDGLNKVLGIPPFTPCIALNFQVISEIDAAIHEIATGKADQIIQGIADLGTALQEVPAAIASCKGAEADVKLLKQAIAIFKNPKILVQDLENLLINGAKVDTQIHAAIKARKDGDFIKYGNAVGQIVGLANTRNPRVSFLKKLIRHLFKKH